MDIVMRPITDIHLNPKNPRKNDVAVEFVANSIREFGFKQPIVVNEDGMILAGNTRYKAAISLGLTEVPVLVASDLDEVKQRATEAWNAITQTVQENIQIAVDAVNGALEWLSNLWENMKEVGKRIVEGIWEGMKGATEWLKELIKGWVGNVTEFLKWLFGINSPSTVMRDQIGKFLPEGIAVGIEANADAVYDEMDAMREKVAEPFDVSVIGADGIHSSQSLRMDDSGIVTAINEVKDYIDKLQVVLSTGETVGALTPYIDSALGRTQAIKAMGG